MFKKRTFLVVPGYQRFEEMREHVSSFSVTFTYAVSTFHFLFRTNNHFSVLLYLKKCIELHSVNKESSRIEHYFFTEENIQHQQT